MAHELMNYLSRKLLKKRLNDINLPTETSPPQKAEPPKPDYKKAGESMRQGWDILKQKGWR